MYCLEIFSDKANKKNALIKLKKLLECEEVVVFGDNFNDLPMIELADRSYAPENAFPEIKEKGTEVLEAVSYTHLVEKEEYMNQPRVGLVGVTCKYESGGQRAEELLSGIKDALKKKNLDVVCAEKVAWDSADAIDVCKQFKKENLDALVIVEVTWTCLLYTSRCV